MFWFFGLEACGILASWSGIKSTSPCTGRQNLNHCTTREGIFKWVSNHSKYPNALPRVRVNVPSCGNSQCMQVHLLDVKCVSYGEKGGFIIKAVCKTLPCGFLMQNTLFQQGWPECVWTHARDLILTHHHIMTSTSLVHPVGTLTLESAPA